MWHKGHPFAFPAIAGVPQSVPGPAEWVVIAPKEPPWDNKGKTLISELAFHTNSWTMRYHHFWPGFRVWWLCLVPCSQLATRQRKTKGSRRGREEEERPSPWNSSHPPLSFLHNNVSGSLMSVRCIDSRAQHYESEDKGVEASWRVIKKWEWGGEDNVLLWMSPPSQAVSFLHYFKFSNGDFWLRKWEWLDHIALQLP